MKTTKIKTIIAVIKHGFVYACLGAVLSASVCGAYAADFYYYGPATGNAYNKANYYSDLLGTVSTVDIPTNGTADIYFGYYANPKKQMFLVGAWGGTVNKLENSGAYLPVEPYDILLNHGSSLTINKIIQNSEAALKLRKTQGSSNLNAAFDLNVGQIDVLKSTLQLGNIDSQHLGNFIVSGKTTIDSSSTGEATILQIYANSVAFNDTVTLKGASGYYEGAKTPQLNIMSGSQLAGAAIPSPIVMSFKDFDFQSGWRVNLGISTRMAKSVSIENIRQTQNTSGEGGTWRSFVTDTLNVTGELSTVGNHSTTFIFSGAETLDVSLNTINMKSFGNQRISFGDSTHTINSATINGTANWDANTKAILQSYAKAFEAKNNIVVDATTINYAIDSEFSFYGGAGATATLKDLTLNNRGNKILTVGTAEAPTESFTVGKISARVEDGYLFTADIYTKNFNANEIVVTPVGSGTYADRTLRASLNFYGEVSAEIGKISIEPYVCNRVELNNIGNIGSIRIDALGAGRYNDPIIGTSEHYFKDISIGVLTLQDTMYAGHAELAASDSIYIEKISTIFYGGSLKLTDAGGNAPKNVTIDLIETQGNFYFDLSNLDVAVQIGGIDIKRNTSGGYTNLAFQNYTSAYKPQINGDVNVIGSSTHFATNGNDLAIKGALNLKAAFESSSDGQKTKTTGLEVGRIIGGGNSANVGVISKYSNSSNTNLVINGNLTGKYVFSGSIRDVEVASSVAQIATLNQDGGGKIGVIMDAAEGVKQYLVGTNFYRGDTVIKGGELHITSSSATKQAAGQNLGRVLLQGGAFSAVGAAQDSTDNPIFSEIGEVRATDMLWSGGVIIVDISGANCDKIILSGNLVKDLGEVGVAQNGKFQIQFRIDDFIEDTEYTIINLVGEDSSIVGFTKDDFEALLIEGDLPEGLSIVFGIGEDGKSLNATVVPEPALVSTILGFAAFAFALRLRRRKR